MLEKKTLSLEEIEGQTAVELPDRYLMASFPLVTVTLKTGEIKLVSIQDAVKICNLQVNVIVAQGFKCTQH